MLQVDFHCHTIASHHAMNTIEEMLRQADRMGMQAIAITDHCPGVDNFFWLIANEPKKANWKNLIKGPDIHYVKTFTNRYQPPEDIQAKLFKGLECNILQEGASGTDVPDILSADLDLIIASIHPLIHLFNSKDKSLVTERVLMAMEDPIDVIGHPFRRGFNPDIEALVTMASEKGIALELNNASLRLVKSESRLLIDMLRLSKEKHCRISLASDAHCTNELGLDESIVPLLDETAFPEELIVNRNFESARAFVDERKKVRREMKPKNSLK